MGSNSRPDWQAVVAIKLGEQTALLWKPWLETQLSKDQMDSITDIQDAVNHAKLVADGTLTAEEVVRAYAFEEVKAHEVVSSSINYLFGKKAQMYGCGQIV